MMDSSEVLAITNKTADMYITKLYIFFCVILTQKMQLLIGMRDAVWLLRACKSSRWQQWCSTEDWPQNIGKCVWRNPHQCLSATVVLCEIRPSGAYWFICRLLPCACHSPGLRLCVSRWLYFAFWLGILGRKPYHLIVHGMCCTKFGISVKSLKGRWGTMGEILVTFDHHFKLNTALCYSNYKFIYIIQLRHPNSGCRFSKSQNIFSTHFTQSTTEICFWWGEI